MEEHIEKRNIINISNVNNINKDRLGLKQIEKFNLNKKIFKLLKFPSGNFVSINQNEIIIWNNNFNKIQEFNFENDYNQFMINLNNKNVMNNKIKLINKKSKEEISEESDDSFENIDNSLNIEEPLFNFEFHHPFDQFDNQIENTPKNILFIKDDNSLGIIYNTNILLYSKKNEQFTLNEIIFDADNNLKCIFFYLNTIISCSELIKVWKKENNKFQCITIIDMKKPIYPISIEKDNFLIAGKNNIFFLNLNEGKIVNSFHINNQLNSEIIKINDDIIVESLKDQTFLISLMQKKIIAKINYEVFSIFPIKNHDFFLAGGKNNDIRFFNIHNGECFRGIETHGEKLIAGIIELNNGSILSYTNKGEVRIWEFCLNYYSIY